MITGYLIGEWGIKFSFVLAGVFLFLAGLVLAPLKLYRGSRNGNPGRPKQGQSYSSGFTPAREDFFSP